jgi:hypothetical protein
MDDVSHHIGNVITPTDEVHHFSEGWQKTTNQIFLGEDLQNTEPMEVYPVRGRLNGLDLFVSLDVW